MKRICDKIADKRLERHRGMAIRNFQTSRIMYTHKHISLGEIFMYRSYTQHRNDIFCSYNMNCKIYGM